jgi:hypothetical protein
VTWFKVDDGLHSHPKWRAATKGARSLWTTAGSWSADNLTDGVVPDYMLSVLDGTLKEAAELVRVGLWEVIKGGWVFHQWNEEGRQPTRESVERERAAAKERQRRARDKARESRRDDGVTDADSHGPPDPTRPDPTRNENTSSSHNFTRGAPSVDDDDLAEAKQRLEELIEAGVEIMNVPAYTAAVLRDIREERTGAKVDCWYGCDKGWILVGEPDDYDPCPTCLPGAAAMQGGK